MCKHDDPRRTDIENSHQTWLSRKVDTQTLESGWDTCGQMLRNARPHSEGEALGFVKTIAGIPEDLNAARIMAFEVNMKVYWK